MAMPLQDAPGGPDRRWELTQWGTLSGYGNGVYNTNLAGVGLRLTTAQSGKVLPYEASYPYKCRGSWASIPAMVSGELIKPEISPAVP